MPDEISINIDPEHVEAREKWDTPGFETSPPDIDAQSIRAGQRRTSWLAQVWGLLRQKERAKFVARPLAPTRQDDAASQRQNDHEHSDLRNSGPWVEPILRREFVFFKSASEDYKIRFMNGRVVCARFENNRPILHDGDHEGYATGDPFMVIGFFNRSNKIPNEAFLRITQPALIFWQIWVHIVRLRGLRYFFSLKDVKGFKIYRCGYLHSHVELCGSDETVLAEFSTDYRSWGMDQDDWALWVHSCLNSSQLDHNLLPIPKRLSLEVLLGWSPIRVSIVILGPVLLSLAIGIWFQSRDPTDLATIQTAWGIASYVATAGGLAAALLAILSSIGDA